MEEEDITENMKLKDAGKHLDRFTPTMIIVRYFLNIVI